MTMVPFVPPTKRAFLPALLLSLVLGAALSLRLMSPDPTTSGASPTQDAAQGSAIVVPLDQRGGGGQHHPAVTIVRSVPEQLAARPEDVAFCVGSALDPFDAAWGQLQAMGPDETAERTRRCLMELVFTHVGPSTVEQVRAQVPFFNQCYQGALALPDPDQRRVHAEVARCLTTSATGQ